MKNLELLTPNGLGPLPVYAGQVAIGGTVTQQGQLKNTGTEALTSLRIRLIQSATQPGILAVSVMGSPVTDTLTELLVGGATLPAGESLPVTLTWSNPPTNLVDAEDSAVLDWDYL